MDLEQLKADHPDLVEAIKNEATAEMEEALAKARKEGADDMLNSIKSKLALSVPGHEKLAEELAYNSDISESEASKRMLDAVRDEKEQFARQFEQEAPPAAKQPGEGDQGGKKKFASLEDRCKAEWEAQPELREEFKRLETYIAAEKSEGKQE